MSRRVWWSHRVGRHARAIVSQTGPRLAIRTRHVQISPRSTYVRVAGFKLFAPRRHR